LGRLSAPGKKLRSFAAVGHAASLLESRAPWYRLAVRGAIKARPGGIIMGNRKQLPALQGSRVQSVDELRQEVATGLLYCHHRANANTTKTLDAAAFTYAVIDLLIEKGVLTEDELNERKRQVAKELVAQFNTAGMAVELQDSAIDKYRFEGSPPIDCENRVHLCKAACCRLRFPLSRQDLEEGVVKWELPRPYLIARRADGYCRHLEQGGCGCTIYEQRPLPCRAYDCRNDARIWADFEKRIVSDKLDEIFAETTPADGAGLPGA
jgi:Fe-S-cluster containining protein